MWAVAVAVAVVVMATVVGAQEPAAAPAQPAVKPPAVKEAAKEQVPLKIQLVLSRYQGEKKLSSVPYALWVTANDNAIRYTSLRMGVQVPITTGASVTYRDVGTNIDCSVVSGLEGRFKVTLTVSDSSVYSADRERPESVASGGSPTLRSFTSSFSILLRDGQTAQYTSATDQVSGEVLKIDATLNVLK